MAYSSLVLYRRDMDGLMAIQDTWRDSYMKCSMLFGEVKSQWLSDSSSEYRLDLVDNNQQVVSSKILKVSDDLSIGQIV
ncbi:hypothetical protein [Vibrio ulleungensis]|uniref:Uncharacterized protein n=1 Tax=Vibrio ulleungensis TaxID=2807619 RepID=A0ABS2HG41_9VIBR|nr:hypothetical protein [Vibrio ulleungensis]MBM7034797.1 hypothetical protein [Vibrio ulleungensis]